MNLIDKGLYAIFPFRKLSRKIFYIRLEVKRFHMRVLRRRSGRVGQYCQFLLQVRPILDRKQLHILSCLGMRSFGLQDFSQKTQRKIIIRVVLSNELRFPSPIQSLSTVLLGRPSILLSELDNG